MFTDGEEERAVDGEEEWFDCEIALLVFLSRERCSLCSFFVSLEAD